METNISQLKVKRQEKCSEILSDGALLFIEKLQVKFNPKRLELLEKRKEQQKRFDLGEKPHFPKETLEIRNSNWTAAPIPEILLDRRVEITGPVDRKMVINALNSGAKVFMADFEDSTSPTWSNLMTGQQNLKDAVNKTITLEDTIKNKKYKIFY